MSAFFSGGDPLLVDRWVDTPRGNVFELGKGGRINSVSFFKNSFKPYGSLHPHMLEVALLWDSLQPCPISKVKPHVLCKYLGGFLVPAADALRDLREQLVGQQ